MTIHVAISDAEKQLAELALAAAQSKQIVVDKAGAPQVRLVGLVLEPSADVERRAAKRRAAIGMYKHLIGDRDINVQFLKADDRWDERYRIKFADPD